ncbi:mitogen-activated protein kinase kinase kinase 7-like, partial [Drosophila navojoa]|uniref:mitogen-activated protein kinase kinase kinase 7-like n=1 Tax=Drosophila navojoa TaxID=7232 RepID=UPI0011BF5971
MEYADNKSLDEYIHNNKNKTITKSHRQNLMLQCAEGVAYLHSLTPLILHRDLKPANILLTNNYCTLKICDFGTARELGPEMTADKGTNVYRAPEIRHNQYTEKCDVYSLALILWEVMSGKKPFHKTDPAYTDAGIPYQTVRGVRPDLKDLNFCENVEIMKDLIEQGWDGEP